MVAHRLLGDHQDDVARHWVINAFKGLALLSYISKYVAFALLVTTIALLLLGAVGRWRGEDSRVVLPRPYL